MKTIPGEFARPALLATAVLFSAAAPARGQPTSVGGNVLIVCQSVDSSGDCRYIGDSGIQDAVDDARDGDTVLVRSGIYSPRAYRDVNYESLTIRGYTLVDSKELRIAGEPGTTLDGAGGAKSSAFVVYRGSVSFENLHIRNFEALATDDDIYDGHGIFVVDSKADIKDVRIENSAKMGLSIRGASEVSATGLSIADGHIGIWIEEDGRLHLSDALIENNDSAGLCAYGSAIVRISRSRFFRNLDDGVYAENDVRVSLRDSIVTRNRPYGIRAMDNSRISVAASVIQANDVDTNVDDAKERILFEPQPNLP